MGKEVSFYTLDTDVNSTSIPGLFCEWVFTERQSCRCFLLSAAAQLIHQHFLDILSIPLHPSLLQSLSLPVSLSAFLPAACIKLFSLSLFSVIFL